MSYRQHFRHFLRYRKIARVYLKYGVGNVIYTLGLDRFLPRASVQALRKQYQPEHIKAIRYCQAATELGPTFIKIGQLFSTRPDIFSPVFIEELEKLQDRVPPICYEEVVKLLTKELGHPDEIFAEFDPEPIAAASIAQVHAARLKSGERVIVKVQRPDIEKIMENDLEILTELARAAENRSEGLRRLGMKSILEDFSRLITKELDFDREGRNTERFRKNFANDKRVVIPKVYWEYTTRRVLTEDYIEGVKLSDIEEITARGWDRHKIAQLGTTTFLTQILQHGFFQADPHPGNMLILDESHIAFIDFGQVSALSDLRLQSIGELLISFSNGEIDRAVATLEDMGILTDEVDLPAFYEDLSELMDVVGSNKIGNVDMNRLRKDFLDLAYRYNLKVPAYLTSLLKALIMVEGVGVKFDPSFNFRESIEPLARQVVRDRLKPENAEKFLRHKYYTNVRPAIDLPAVINRFVHNTDHGRLKMGMQVSFSEPARRSLIKIVNQLSASLIIAGGLVSSALIIQSSEPEFFVSHSTVGIVGFGVSLLALLIFAVSFFRRG